MITLFAFFCNSSRTSFVLFILSFARIDKIISLYLLIQMFISNTLRNNIQTFIPNIYKVLIFVYVKMQHKTIVQVGLVGFMLLVGFAFFVSATPPEVNIHSTTSLTFGNDRCEYYHHTFSQGDSEILTINGASLSIAYLGDGEWQLNDYQGEVVNNNFFVHNSDARLKGVRFSFYSLGGRGFRDGVFGLTEQDYYPWDCQGHSSRGLVQDVKVEEGWNLVPFTAISLRDCSYALEGELCQDDILASYIYYPPANRYFSLDELEEAAESDSDVMDYFSDESVSEHLSYWIYVKPGAGDKKLIGRFGSRADSGRDDTLNNGILRLKKGFNFMFLNAFMAYDDDWREAPLSMEDMKGSCEFEGFFLWVNEYPDQGWLSVDIQEEIHGDAVFGHGIVLEVDEDCALGYGEGEVLTPPTIGS